VLVVSTRIYWGFHVLDLFSGLDFRVAAPGSQVGSVIGNGHPLLKEVLSIPAVMW
jgi:hypothetical protein